MEALASQTDAFLRLLPDHDAVLFSDYGKGGLAHIHSMMAAARSAGVEKLGMITDPLVVK